MTQHLYPSLEAWADCFPSRSRHPAPPACRARGNAQHPPDGPRRHVGGTGVWMFWIASRFMGGGHRSRSEACGRAPARRI